MLILAACGGGGAGGGSEVAPTPTPTPYALVQPAMAPVSPSIDKSRASGFVSVAADTLAPLGRRAGVSVELRPIQGDGTLGAVKGVASTAADGSFSIDLPTGGSTADGSWMLVAQVDGVGLRAYLYPGSVRVDVSSEAWVRQVAAAAGRILAFPDANLSVVSQIAAAFGLIADATGDQRASLALGAAADQLLSALSNDRALDFVASTLRKSGSLPSEGTGDIGAFYAMSNTYAAIFADDTGRQLQLVLKDEYGYQMAVNGTWEYNGTASVLKDGQWQAVPSSGGRGRLSPSRGYQRLPISDPQLALVSYVVGEFPSQSFPVQPGARQLDARRITDTKLNFTGGSDIQPLAFSVNQIVGAVETISLGIGSFRAVPIVTEEQLVLPKSASTVSTTVLRSTVWVAPGVGILKERDQVFVDGIEDKAGALNLELKSAYANKTVWPAQLTINAGKGTWASNNWYCLPIIFSNLRRAVTVEYGPVVQSSPTLALALWDIDTGLQIGATRNFSGFRSTCPVPSGDEMSLLAAEHLSPLDASDAWPKTEAAALALSELVHKVSAKDLSDMATYRLAAVPDVSQPSKYWPAALTALFAAPDGSGRFIAAYVKKGYGSSTSGLDRYIQVLGPAVASPVARVANEILLGVDWSSGQLYSNQNVDPLDLYVRSFSTADGVDQRSIRTIRSGRFFSNFWFASKNFLHLNDGSTVRVSDGSPGPKLPYKMDECAVGKAVLVCVDSGEDQLVKIDIDTLSVQGKAGLGSYLRSWSQSNPDFRISNSILRSPRFLDDSTLLVNGFVVRVGRWNSVTSSP
ncbi:hypothetical protein [Roseateles sp.]|uniref:hypothetical protein n=1 Tax=Roseateles sp. TaxID=1971397 RepID=UPI003BA46F04